MALKRGVGVFARCRRDRSLSAMLISSEVYVKLRSLETIALDFFGPQTVLIGHAETLELLYQVLQGHPRIHKGSQAHISRNSRRTL